MTNVSRKTPQRMNGHNPVSDPLSPIYLSMQIKAQSLPLAKLTNRLSSPNAFPSLPPSPASTLAALNRCGNTFPPACGGENRWLEVGENRLDDDGEAIMRSWAGSISSDVRKEVSARSSLVAVTDK